MSSSLDRLRGWYKAAPAPLRETLGRGLALLPADWRYGKTCRDIHITLDRARSDAAFVQAERLKALRQLIKTACNAPYYQAVFRKTYGGLPDIDQFDFAELAKLPLLTKDDLRADPERLLAVPRGQMDAATTSGSSGKPLMFFLDKDRSAKEFGYVSYLWSQIGYDYRRHKRAMLRGIQLKDVDEKPWEYDPALKELRLSPFHLTPSRMGMFLELMQRYEVDFLQGYPSSLVLLADYMIEEKVPPPPSLKGILPVSEATFPHQIERFKRAFPHCKMMKFYGMSEKSLIAGQVGDTPELYEFEPLYGHAEIVDEHGEPITTQGQTGRIIGTGFISHGMPLLRYDTEDVADFIEAPSAENHYRLRAANIRGRWGEEYVLGANQELISISAINIHSLEYTKIHAFQLYQDTPGEVAIKVMPKPGVSQQELDGFRAEMQAKTGAHVQYHLQMVDALPFNTANGKRKFIDQKIDLAPYFHRQSPEAHA